MQAGGLNLTARYDWLSGYDPTRKLSHHLLQATGEGAATGAILSALGSLVGLNLNRQKRKQGFTPDNEEMLPHEMVDWLSGEDPQVVSVVLQVYSINLYNSEPVKIEWIEAAEGRFQWAVSVDQEEVIPYLTEHHPVRLTSLDKELAKFADQAMENIDNILIPHKAALTAAVEDISKKGSSL